MPVTSELAYAGASDPGLQRSNNEDRFYIDGERGIFIVIDGIGGQAAGEIAADIAQKVLTARLERQTGTVDDRLREAITLANNEIYKSANTHEEWRGMACVLTAAVLEDRQLTIGHVGDTRLYKIRDGIQKVTHDHSPTGVREDSQELTESQAMRHPRRNEVYRDIGSEEHTPHDEDFIEILHEQFEPDSALLLCSDGLTDLVNSSEILEVIGHHADEPARVVAELISAANKAGGKDNVTAVFIKGEDFPRRPRKETVHEVTSGKPVDSKYFGGELSGEEGSRFSRQAHAAAKLIKQFLFSRWAFLIYGALLAVPVTLMLQRYFRPNVVGEQTPSQAPGRGKSLVVSQSGESEFVFIGDALSSAQPGDTVIVAPGEYRERIQLKEGVALISLKPREAVILLPDGTQEPAVEAANIKTGRFAGFKIQGHEKAPLQVGLRLTNSGVSVEDSEVAGARIAGIEISGNGFDVIRANYIHDNPGVGIVISGAKARPRLVHNIVVLNGKQPQNNKAGIEIVEQAQPKLIGNYLSGNGLEGVSGLNAEAREEVTEKNIFSPSGTGTNIQTPGGGRGSGTRRRNR